MDPLAVAKNIDSHAAAERIRGVCVRTPLRPFELTGLGLELRLKLECEQVTNSFKARGAWNQVSQLTDAERAAGICAVSSGNHARAVAWAAKRAGVRATVFMPANSYRVKIEACRAEGAEVVLCETREESERLVAEAAASGKALVHPYDALRTVEGAGTVGLEIAEDWPEVELVLFPVGGGGLIAGAALAIARELGDEVSVVGVEPEGSPNLTRSFEEDRPVPIDPITTEVQGLCPIVTGELNLALAKRYVEGMVTLTDEEIYAGQRELVRTGLTVEAAGAAAFAAVRAGALPPDLLEDRDHPLRVACVVTGGNADPEQLAGLTS